MLFTHFSHFIRGQFHLRQEITHIFNFYVIFGTLRQKMQEPLVLPHFSFLFHSFSVYKSAHDSGLHLLSYNTVLISCTIIRTFPELLGDKPIHLVLIQILGTDIVLIILIIFVIHTVFAAGTDTFLLLSIRYLNPVSVFAFKNMNVPDILCSHSLL